MISNQSKALHAFPLARCKEVRARERLPRPSGQQLYEHVTTRTNMSRRGNVVVVPVCIGQPSSTACGQLRANLSNIGPTWADVGPAVGRPSLAHSWAGRNTKAHTSETTHSREEESRATVDFGAPASAAENHFESCSPTLALCGELSRSGLWQPILCSPATPAQSRELSPATPSQSRMLASDLECVQGNTFKGISIGCRSEWVVCGLPEARPPEVSSRFGPQWI